VEEGRVLIGGDSLLLLSLEAEAEKAVTGCLGHGRFASFSLVTGLTPKATGARAFADADAWWRATSREATAIVTAGSAGPGPIRACSGASVGPWGEPGKGGGSGILRRRS